MSEQQIFQISADTRVVAKLDLYPRNIEQVVSDYGLGVETLMRPRYNSSFSVEAAHTDEVKDFIQEGENGASPEDIDEMISNYFTSRKVSYVIRELRGYSQGEWHKVVVWSPNYVYLEGELERVVDEIEAYYTNDVYEVFIEKAKTFTADDGEAVVQWRETDDSYLEVVERLFTLDADWIRDNLGLEVLPEVEG